MLIQAITIGSETAIMGFFQGGGISVSILNTT